MQLELQIHSAEKVESKAQGDGCGLEYVEAYEAL